MTYNILRSWDPHAARLMDTLRNEFRIVARDVDGEKPDSALARSLNVEGIKRDFNRLFYTQFKTHADFEAYLEKVRGVNTHDLDTVAGQEAAAIHALRHKVPYGSLETASGPAFAETNGVKGEVRNFSALLGDLVPNVEKLRHTEIVSVFERTASAFNVCLVATRHNTVRDHAEEMGREVWQAKERSLFGKKPLNVFRFVPAEESAIDGVPDRLVQLVEKGVRMEQPVVFDVIPRRLDEIWSGLGPHLDYIGQGSIRMKDSPSAHTVAHRAYRDFTLGA